MIRVIRPGLAACDRTMVGRCHYCGCQAECVYGDTETANHHEMAGSYIQCPTKKCDHRISMRFIHPQR